MEDYTKLMNYELFEVCSPEMYTNNLPKYFTKPKQGLPPMINGARVSWEEYLEAHPEFQKDDDFIPEPIYNPHAMNMTTSMVPISTIVDMIENEVDISIAKPETTYPRVLEILKGYLDMSSMFLENNPELKRYYDKAVNAYNIINTCYANYRRKLSIRATGSVQEEGDGFDKIQKLFS